MSQENQAPEVFPAMILVCDREGNYDWTFGPGSQFLTPSNVVAALELAKANMIDGMRQTQREAMAKANGGTIQQADATLLDKLKKRMGK